MTYREVIELVEADGWFVSRTAKGSHRVYKHPSKKGPLVIASGGKLSRDVPTGTLSSILKQAGLKV